MVVGFKYRIQKDGIDAKVLQISAPVHKLADPRLANPIVVNRGAAEADRINLIKNTIESPHE